MRPMEPLFDVSEALRRIVPFIFGLGAAIWTVIGLLGVTRELHGLTGPGAALVVGWVLMASAITIHLAGPHRRTPKPAKKKSVRLWKL